jgi:hypothetical protein
MLYYTQYLQKTKFKHKKKIVILKLKSYPNAKEAKIVHSNRLKKLVVDWFIRLAFPVWGVWAVLAGINAWLAIKPERRWARLLGEQRVGCIRALWKKLFPQKEKNSGG